MTQSIAKQISALQKMTPKELRARYAEVFGEPTRSGNKPQLLNLLNPLIIYRQITSGLSSPRISPNEQHTSIRGQPARPSQRISTNQLQSTIGMCALRSNEPFCNLIVFASPDREFHGMIRTR